MAVLNKPVGGDIRGRAGQNRSGVPDSARAILKQLLDQYGLGSLASWAWNVYTGSGGGTVGMDAITAELPNTAEFKVRFPAYDALAKAGRAMSVKEMLSYEQTARQIFHANGIPQGFYDTTAELAKFMLGDVSVAELEARVKDAQVAMYTAPQDVRDSLQRLYGIDHGHMTAFFLDPSRAEPLIQQKFTAAQIAAEADRTRYGQLTATQAEQLAAQGVTDQSAAQGFNRLGMNRGLFEAQTQGEHTIGVDEQLAAQFGGNVTAQTEFERRKAARLAQFQEQSGFRPAQKGIGGLGPSDSSS